MKRGEERRMPTSAHPSPPIKTPPKAGGQGEKPRRNPGAEAYPQLVIPAWADAAYVAEVAQPDDGGRGRVEYEAYPAKRRGKHTNDDANGDHHCYYYFSVEWRPLARGAHLKRYAHMILEADPTPDGRGKSVAHAIRARSENADQPGYIIVSVEHPKPNQQMEGGEARQGGFSHTHPSTHPSIPTNQPRHLATHPPIYPSIHPLSPIPIPTPTPHTWPNV